MTLAPVLRHLAPLCADLHAVVLRNGPGSWVRNADSDECYLQVTNLSASPVQLTGAATVRSTTSSAGRRLTGP